MKLNTSSYLLNNKNKLKKIIDILSKEFKYVSILGSDVEGERINVSSSSINVGPSFDDQKGFVLRVFSEIGFSEYSFNVIDEEEIINNIRNIVNTDRKNYLKYSNKIDYKNFPNDDPTTIFYVQEINDENDKYTSEYIINELSNMVEDAIKKYDEVMFVGSNVSTTQVNKLFLSKNKDLYQTYKYSTAHVVAVSKKDNIVKNEFLASSNFGGLEFLGGLKEKLDIACKRSIELLDSERVVAGTYDIICDPDFTGLIAHEAFGHGAEMDMFVKDRAKGKEYMNKRVASDLVVMRDGASSYNEVSSYKFDDEGNLASDTKIIDKGILVNGMCDELSSLQLNINPTGNGKRESYKRKAYTRMTNTFFEDGEASLDDMISSIKFGYLLEGFSSGMEDPKNWGIQCVASKGREIKDGKLTGKVVSPVYLTGYVPELLESISMVSKGLKLSGSGYCGKGWKEWVKTSTGGSYIKAKGRLS